MSGAGLKTSRYAQDTFRPVPAFDGGGGDSLSPAAAFFRFTSGTVVL